MTRKTAKASSRAKQVAKASSSRLGGVEELLQKQVSQLKREALGFVNTRRTSLEKNIREQFTTMSKRTNQLRRQLEKRISKGVKAAETRIGKTAERMFKELKLPTQAQIKGLRSEMAGIRRQLEQLSDTVQQLESSHLHGKVAS